jgi:hypothetical protein
VKFTEKTRKVIEARACGRCELCGIAVSGAQIHHRQARGMGGSKDLEARSSANGLYLHDRCHERIERNRTEAYENGWLVHKWEDSGEKPVKMWDGWKTLGDDGSLTAVVSTTDLGGESL